MHAKSVVLLFLLGFSLVVVACQRQDAATGADDGNGVTGKPWTPPKPHIVSAGGASFDIACTLDADCELVNTDYGYNCCYEGYCDAPQYAQDAWISVNSDALDNAKVTQCTAECGPAPGCPTLKPAVMYVPKCNKGLCTKVQSN